MVAKALQDYEDNKDKGSVQTESVNSAAAKSTVSKKPDAKAA
jgi:hypothetical protein